MEGSTGGSRIRTASWTKLSSNGTRAVPLVIQKPRVLPSVVLQHVEKKAQANSVERAPSSFAASDGTASQASACSRAPGKDEESGSPTWQTREQKRAVRAFASLHAPVAGKSLGVSLSLANQAERDDLSSYYEEQDRLKHQHDSSLDSMIASAVFLFPTMTRQRQLHSKYVANCQLVCVVCIQLN